MNGQTVLSSLNPTERQIIEILAREGPKAAPDLGHRLKKSREHIARLMKKLYFEGYVDRESNRSPFKYALNDKVRSESGLASESIT
jgi:predicted ArsR family transcriptional regulator